MARPTASWTGSLGEPRAVPGSSYAVVRITALAACLLAAHPDWRAAELKAALFALARPPADTHHRGQGRRAECPSDLL